MNKSLPNSAENEGGQIAQSIKAALQAEDEASDLGDKSRRDAMAILAKHTAYMAPAVLAILSMTTKRAAAFSF